MYLFSLKLLINVYKNTVIICQIDLLRNYKRFVTNVLTKMKKTHTRNKFYPRVGVRIYIKKECMHYKKHLLIILKKKRKSGK